MYSSMESIGFSTYFNDLVNYFYEDERLVEQFGERLGFDVNQDIFLGVVFLFPSAEQGTFDEKEQLKEHLSVMHNLPSVNSQIKQNQFFYVDNGVATFLIARDKDEIMKTLPAFKKEAVDLLESMDFRKKIRVGFGLPEKGIAGIKRTYSYAMKAVKAGEIFKKERIILDYMGMEIYSSINAMVTNYGKQITDIVFRQLSEVEISVLAKYYKCKEDIDTTARVMNIPPDLVREYLANVKKSTGLDVHDTEDSFKLHLLMIAKKVLDTNKKIDKIKENNHYECILLDIDDTLLDFQANERESFIKVLNDYGYENAEDYLPVYKKINDALWKEYEQGMIKRPEVLNTRFSKMMKEFGKDVSGEEWEARYRSYLNEGTQMIEDAEEICQWLRSRYRLFIVSNGVAQTQKKRLRASGLDRYFEQIFVSEEVGAQKPSKEFFSYVEDHISGFDKHRALIVGDSYSSDILGGQQYGIDTCWFIRGDIKAQEAEKKSTYRISGLKQLKDILD